jgi:hypothetical protein
VPGATDRKYMDELVEVLPQMDRWTIFQAIDKSKFDFNWRPNPTEPAYIYTWGNKFVPAEMYSTVEYHCPGATDRKYMDELVEVLPDMDRWNEVQLVDKNSFDFNWRPNPNEPSYIYVWGNKYISAEIYPTLEYHCPGATDRKYMDELVEVLPQMDRWNEVQLVDKNSFDFNWRPNPLEPAYIYTWGNKFIPAEVHPTLEYHCPDATDRKYMDELVEVLPDMDRWVEVQSINRNSFDFSWRPNPNEPAYIYVWGNKHIPVEIKPTLEYHVPGATDRKYMDELVEVLPDMDRWVEVQTIDKTKFDFSWRPDPREPAYIYTWGNKFIPAEVTPTLEYHCKGATKRKYMNELVELATLMNRWTIVQAMDTNSFDFTWVPDPREPAYIYTWGSKYIPAEVKPTLEYHCPGATTRKYMSELVNLQPNWDRWNIVQEVDKNSFDFGWTPDPREPAYIYVWGNKHIPAEVKPSLEYHCPGATTRKYLSELVEVVPEWGNWIIPEDIDLTSFDFSWRPDPNLPPYQYQFGTQWQKTNGPTYVVKGSTEIKYVEDTIATIKSNMTNWIIPVGFDVNSFDFSWHPDSTSPPYVYQFGTLLDDVHLEDGPKYVTPNNDGYTVLLENSVASSTTIKYPTYYIETTLNDLIEQHKNEIFWALQKDIDYTEFNFDWRPTKENVFNISTFGSSESVTTQTYLVNGKLWQKGYRDINFVENTILDSEYLSKLFKQVDMFFIDKNNKESAERFEQIKQRFPNIQKTRYISNWVDTINRCITKSTTDLCWILNSELDYTDFDFNYYPNPWQMKMVHVFGTQWNHWGTTFMVNKKSFPEDTKYVKIIEHLAMLNFVKNRRAKSSTTVYDIIYINHGNTNFDDDTTVVNYEGSYLNTFRKILEILPEKKDHQVWICSSICDYDNFDFSYVCDPFSKDQLHVFPSNNQKFGDTFLVDINKLRTLIDDMNVLEDYEKINYNTHQKAKRLPAPVIISQGDTHVSHIHTNYTFPYATFKTLDNKELKFTDEEPMNLWASESKNIIIHSTGGTIVSVPKEAGTYIEKELYDYPYISTSSKLTQSKPLDIVFLSNGEIGADENYEHLLNVTKGLTNRVVRVDGIDGRVQAYHAAAEASNTPWMFTVFAKLKVNSNFDWYWQPDRLQVPKHYIFHATNPVNGLVYGHQAMIAYNKMITLTNMGKGLDFTLDNEHEVVELNSGEARYNTDEFSTWRTSFRECIKLHLEDSTVSRYRLNKWSTVAKGDYAQYSIDGALDAVEYFEQVNGDIGKLRLSYDWPWLQMYFNNKYN